jgi:hypothetical protein
MEEGDHVILLINSNLNMKTSDISNVLQQISLQEVIIQRHSMEGPATHKRNSTKTAIDGSWATPGIQKESAGYFEYDEVVPNMDHQCLWVDLSLRTAFGHNTAPFCKKQPRQHHYKDPRLIDNYVRLFHQFAKPLNLYERVKALGKIPAKCQSEVMAEYESLDLLQCQVAEFAERKCRKLQRGQVAFSPRLSDCRSKIKAWLLLLSRVKGRKLS